MWSILIQPWNKLQWKTTNNAQFCMATPVLLFRILLDLLPCFIILILYVMLRLRLSRNTLWRNPQIGISRPAICFPCFEQVRTGETELILGFGGDLIPNPHTHTYIYINVYTVHIYYIIRSNGQNGTESINRFQQSCGPSPSPDLRSFQLSSPQMSRSSAWCKRKNHGKADVPAVPPQSQWVKFHILAT